MPTVATYRSGGAVRKAAIPEYDTSSLPKGAVLLSIAHVEGANTGRLKAAKVTLAKRRHAANAPRAL